MTDNFISINSSKANFDEIYVKDDPRAYFSVLGALDYMIPDVAAPLVRQIIAAYARRYSRKPRVLDVGSSYGINAAVHRFPVTFASLRRRYARHEMAAHLKAMGPPVFRDRGKPDKKDRRDINRLRRRD